ncbi:MAG: NUDIX domain-containing protein [Candidatus Methylacidiphilales bacterium]|nr:NUDIX domain-containing protein [Candidatus Methylacidiphilales bacterium]
MSVATTETELMVDYVDASDQVLGRASLGSIQSSFRSHRWFAIFIYNDAGEILLQCRSETHSVSPHCWDVTCDGFVPAGQDYDTAARRALVAEIGIDWETAPLRPFTKIPASLENSMRFIQLYTCGPLNGPLEPPSPEIADVAFVRPEDIDAYIESSPNVIGELLTIAWRARDEIAAQLANPSPVLPPPIVIEEAAVRSAPEIVKTSSLQAEIEAGKRKSGADEPSDEDVRSRLMLGLLGFGMLVVWRFRYTAIKMAIGLSGLMMLYGLPFAAGLLVLIAIHELAHIAAAQIMGVRFNQTMLIPFVGTSLTLKNYPRDPWTEAVIAYSGPLAGTIAATACGVAGLVISNPLLMALGLAAFAINLIQFAPFPMLDGERICTAISQWAWLGATILVGGVVICYQGIASILVFIFFALFIFARNYSSAPATEEDGEEVLKEQACAQLPLERRYIMGGLYFGLLCYMLAGCVSATAALHKLDPRTIYHEPVEETLPQLPEELPEPK